MLHPRIIPCLLIKTGALVKTTKFCQDRYIGDPINAARIFNEKKVDELLVLDIDAGTQGREPNYALIKSIAEECQMPLCYGGGITRLDQALKIISLGVEKIALSSSLFMNPALVGRISKEIGSQSVVAVLDVSGPNIKGDYDIFIANATKKMKTSLFEMLPQLESLGCGEVVINSIVNDGMMCGYDLNLAGSAKSLLKIPLTILGGCGGLEDMRDALNKCGLIGMAAGSFLIYKGKHKAVLLNYPSQIDRENVILKKLFV